MTDAPVQVGPTMQGQPGQQWKDAGRTTKMTGSAKTRPSALVRMVRMVGYLLAPTAATTFSSNMFSGAAPSIE